jgi:hypothetical protein
MASRLIMLLFILSAALNAGSVLQSAKNVKEELGEQGFLEEYKRFAPFEKSVNALDEFQKNAYKKGSSDRFKILDKLLKYQKQSSSLIIAQYTIDQALKYVNINDIKKFKKYIKPNAEVLYKRGMCDGYLFEGIYMQKIKGDKIKAFDIYRRGVDNCKIGWKRMNILSRMNQLKYQLGIIGKKK